MKNYKLRIKEQIFTFEDVDDLKSKVRSIMEVGIWAIETHSSEETPKEEEMLKESVQKIKPIIIDSKVLKMARRGVRRRQKYPEEMVYFVKQNMNEMSNEELAKSVNQKFGLKINEGRLACYLNAKHLKRENSNRQRVERKKEKKKTSQKYPLEMKEFIKDNMNVASNSDLCVLINEKWNVNMTKVKLNSYMTYNDLRRENPLEFREPRKKKGDKPKKFTPEVTQFLRENINNFSNKELCEELEARFSIQTNINSLQAHLSLKGIKRYSQPGVDQEIVEFIKKHKTDDIYKLKDKVIIKFEKDISVPELRKIINSGNNLKGESQEDEVKRIKEQREPFDDNEEIDGLELD